MLVANLAKAVQAGDPIVLGKIAEAAGYSRQNSETPSRILNSKGVKELMEEAGLTDRFVLDALHDDIRDKPKRRVRELELAARIKGWHNGDQSSGNTYIQINLSKTIAAKFDTPTTSGEPQTAPPSDPS